MAGGRRLYRNEQTSNGSHLVRVLDNLGLKKKDLDVLHTTLDNEKALVLEIVEECKKGNFKRFTTLSKGGGLDWVRIYVNISNQTWKTWQTKSYTARRKQKLPEKS